MARQKTLFNIVRKDTTKQVLNKTKLVETQPQALNITSANKFDQVIQAARQLVPQRDDLEMIVDDAKIVSYINRAIEVGKIAIDTETEGLNPMQNSVVGLCLYTKGEKGIYIPYKHRSYMTNVVKDGQVTLENMQKYFNMIQDSGVKQIYHNAKFDVRMIKNSFDVLMTPYWDTKLCSVVLNENEPHSLKTLHSKYVMKEKGGNKKYDELFDGFDFGLVPLDIAYKYAGYDAIMTYELQEFQEKVLERPHLKGLKNTFMNIEMPVLPVVIDMEETGNCIDLDYAEELNKKYSKKLEDTHNEVMNIINSYSAEIDAFKRKRPDLAGKLEDPINISSPTQLAILLYDIIKVGVIDKKKPRGTGKEILKAIDIPLTNAILEYRTVEKLMTTYITKLPNCIEAKTGRLHGQFNQDGTDTGRFSSKDPNLQNIPSKNKEIRKMFVAPKGYLMIGGDYSQQEPRCLAFLSQDQHLLDAYFTGKDVYADMASKIYHVPYEECKEFRPDGTVNPEGKKRRSSVKSIVLGIMYGRQANSIAEQTGMTPKEAEDLIATFFETFKGVDNFIKKAQSQCREKGYVEMIWGRKRRIRNMMLSPYEFKDTMGKELPANVVNNYTRKLNNARGKQREQIIRDAKKLGIIIVDNTWKIADAERQVVNSIIQGSSAEITKKAMILIGNDPQLKEWGFKLCLTIHDEVIGIIKEEYAQQGAERMAKLMIDAPKDKLNIPMKVDTEVTRCWYGDAVEFDEEGNIIG